MRTARIVAVSIACCLITPVRAANSVNSDAMSVQEKTIIEQQQERMKEFHRQLGMEESDGADAKTRADKKVVWRSMSLLNGAYGKNETDRGHANGVKERSYFDLTNISVVCFLRDGRPVCGPIARGNTD